MFGNKRRKELEQQVVELEVKVNEMSKLALRTAERLDSQTLAILRLLNATEPVLSAMQKQNKQQIKTNEASIAFLEAHENWVDGVRCWYDTQKKFNHGIAEQIVKLAKVCDEFNSRMKTQG